MPKRKLPMPVFGQTPVMTRDEASMKCLTSYFTGTYCRNGHLDWRYVSTAGCHSCLKPPKPISPYTGLDGYQIVMHPKLRLPALPPPQHADKFVKYLESCGWFWLHKVVEGVPPPPDEAISSEL